MLVVYLLALQCLTAGLTPRVTAEQAQNVTAARANAEKSLARRALRRSRHRRAGVSQGRTDRRLSRASASRRAATTRAPNRSCSRSPRANRRRSGARARPAAARIGKRTEGRRTLTLLLMADGANPTARDYLRAARAARALGRVDDAQSFFRDAIAARAERSAHQHRVGRAVPREVQQGRSGEVVPGGAEGRSRVRPGAARHGAGARRREPAAGGASSRSAR